MEKIPNYSCIKCGKYLHQHQLPVYQVYQYPKSASMGQSETCELMWEKTGSNDIHLPETSHLAQGNDMEIVSSTVMGLDSEVFKQMSEIPLKMTKKSCTDLSKPVITDSADLQMPLDCGKHESGLFHKENEERAIGVSPTSRMTFRPTFQQMSEIQLKMVQISCIDLSKPDLTEVYKCPDSASLRWQSDPSELVAQNPRSNEINLRENFNLAQGNNTEIMSSTITELYSDTFKQIFEIPSKIARKSRGRLSKPAVLTNYADCKMPPECGKNYSGDELIRKENEALNMGCSSTSKDNRSKSVRRKRYECDILNESPKKLCKSSYPSNFSASSPDGTSDPVATSSLNFTKNKPNKFQGNSTKESYNCNYCEYLSNCSSDVRRHERTHTGQKPYKCKNCSYVAADHKSLQRHERTHTGEKPHKCDYCGYRAAKLYTLRQHERIHTGEKPYKCKLCSYSATRATHLRSHERTHTGEKPYKCKHCSYRASDHKSLQRHERTHTGEKPHKCEYCGYRAAKLKDLRKHERIHTGEKPFKCEHCNYSATQRTHLRLHERTHTGEKPYQCQHCDYRSTQSSSLRRHELIHILIK